MSKLATQSNKHPFRSKLITFLVQGFGSGRIPFMPGTWGSVVGLLLVYFVSIFGFTMWQYAAITAVVCAASWWLIFLYEKKSQTHDESSVVIDEIAGIFVCFLGMSFYVTPLLFAGFVLFRFFDIVKPFPISWIDQKIPGAIGTLLDDLVAGAVVCGLLHGFLYYGSTLIGGN